MVLPLLALTGSWAILPRVLDELVASIETVEPSLVDRAISASASESSAREKAPPYAVSEGVATIPLRGPVMKGEPWLLWLLGATSPDRFSSLVTQAAADPDVKAILLDVDSPGGMIGGCSEAADAVAAAGRSKPTHAYVGDLCASAAYWIASQAKTMHGGPSAMAGSLGVYRILRDSSQAASHLGVKVHVVRSGAYKGNDVAGTPITDETLADEQRIVDSVASLFNHAVASGRKMKLETVQQLADGRVWIGKDAADRGLLDGVASRAAVVSALRNYKPGRKAVHIAASAAGDETMSLWDQIKAKLGATDDPDEEQASAKSPPTAHQLPPPVFLQGALDNPLQAQFDAQKKQLELQQAEVERLKAIALEQTKAANRAACEAHMKAGRFAAADLDKNIDRRAKDPALFDELMAERPPLTLAMGAMISGEAAVTEVDKTAGDKFTEECVAYIRAQYRPELAAAIRSGQKGGS